MRLGAAAAFAATVALAWGAAGCAPKPKSPPRQAYTPPGWTAGAAPPAQGWASASPPPTSQLPSPYGAPLGETKDPWRAPSGSPEPPPAPFASVEGPFLLLLAWGGAGAETRAPDVHATLARLGGIRRAPTLWEIAPQPGGGLAQVASALERELCAEDIVIVWRARGAAMLRSEFAGHRSCPALPAAPEPAPKASPRGRAPMDPFSARH